jgi:hypothetical protein
VSVKDSASPRLMARISAARVIMATWSSSLPGALDHGHPHDMSARASTARLGPAADPKFAWLRGFHVQAFIPHGARLAVHPAAQSNRPSRPRLSTGLTERGLAYSPHSRSPLLYVRSDATWLVVRDGGHPITVRLAP